MSDKPPSLTTRESVTGYAVMVLRDPKSFWELYVCCTSRELADFYIDDGLRAHPEWRWKLVVTTTTEIEVLPSK